MSTLQALLRQHDYPNLYREAADRIDALEAENSALLALLIRAAPLLEDYAEYANTAPIWHATGGTADAVNPLVVEVNAAIARSKT